MAGSSKTSSEGEWSSPFVIEALGMTSMKPGEPHDSHGMGAIVVLPSKMSGKQQNVYEQPSVGSRTEIAFKTCSGVYSLFWLDSKVRGVCG